MELRSRFLELYPEFGTVELTAAQVPISRGQVYDWIRSDPDFASKIKELKPVAKGTYLGALEQEAHRRAVEGVLEPVFYKGELVEHVRKFSDVLLIVLLKANAPEKYIDRSAVDNKLSGEITLKVVEDGNSNSGA